MAALVKEYLKRKNQLKYWKFLVSLTTYNYFKNIDKGKASCDFMMKQETFFKNKQNIMNMLVKNIKKLVKLWISFNIYLF